MATPKRSRKAEADALMSALLRDKGRTRIPQLADIAAAFIDELGGPGEFSRQLVAEFQGAAVGSMQRIKIIDIVMRGLKTTDERPDVTKLSEADLRRLLEIQHGAYEELAADEPAGPTAGPAEPGPAAPAPEAGGQEARHPPAAAADPGLPPGPPGLNFDFFFGPGFPPPPVGD